MLPRRWARPPRPAAWTRRCSWVWTEVTQICPVPLPSWLSDSGGKGIQVCAVVHGEAQLTGRWGDHGRQVVLDTSSVKVFLPGITDTTTLDAVAKLCGQASWKVRGQDHATRHDVATPDMVRQLPAGFALVIRGGCAPVIARLPRAWKNPAYRRARRLGQGPAEPIAETATYPEPQRRTPGTPDLSGRMAFRQRHLLPLELTMSCNPITTAPQQLAGYQARILPAVAAQLTTETTGCGPTQPHSRLISEAMRRTDNGAAPPGDRPYRLPENGPLPDLPLYERLIGEALPQPTAGVPASITSPPGGWPSGWPPGRRARSSPGAWSTSPRPERSAQRSGLSCASTPAPALIPISSRPPGSCNTAWPAAPTLALSARNSARPAISSTALMSCWPASTTGADTAVPSPSLPGRRPMPPGRCSGEP